MEISERVKELCKNKGITIARLERELNFGNGTIRNWDRNSPSIDKIQKVADYFKVSTDFLLYGFDKASFVKWVNIIRRERTYEQFSKDTGVDLNELSKICMGIITEQPSFETIRKITDSNKDYVDILIGHNGLFKAAGYDIEEPPVYNNAPKYTPITDVKQAMEVILAQPGLMLNGEALSDESKIALANAINMGLVYAEQMQKKEKEQKETKDKE